MDGGDQLFRLRALEQEAGGPGVEGAEDVVVLLEGRQDRDLDRGRDREDFAGCRDAVEVRHAHIHENDVRGQRAGLLDGAAAVARLADDLDRLVAREHRLEAGAHEVVVVDEEHAHPPWTHAPLPPYGRRAPDAEDTVGGARLEATAEQGRSLAHADDPVAASGGSPVRAGRVAHSELESARTEGDVDLGASVSVASGCDWLIVIDEGSLVYQGPAQGFLGQVPAVIALAPEHLGDLDRLAALARADGHEPRREDTELIVPVEEHDARAAAAALNKAAIARGIVLAELHVRRPSLESQYLAVIDGRER
jgi:hypothetical protein